MAELSELNVEGQAKINADTIVDGNVESTSLDGRSFLSSSAKVTPSTSGTGIVTEQYLYWALKV